MTTRLDGNRRDVRSPFGFTGSYAPMYRDETDWEDEEGVKSIAEAVKVIIAQGHYVEPNGSEGTGLRLWQWVLVPEKDSNLEKFVRIWDDVIILCLLLATYVVPLTVAFPELCQVQSAVFGRILDLLFTTDIIINCRLAYRVRPTHSCQDGFEKRPLKILRRYSSIPFSYQGDGGWLWLDLPAIVPGWWELAHGRLLPILTENDGSTFSNMVQFARLTRFLRLMRNEKQERFRDSIESFRVDVGFPYTLTEMLKFIFLITLTCHLAACVWVMIEGKVTIGVEGVNAEVKKSWLSELIATKGDPCCPSAEKDPMCVYLLALYWSMMTLTTVGYGDITPQNRQEYMTCTIYMIIAGFIWSYIVGSVVAMLSDMDPHRKEFMQEVDAINNLMTRRNISPPLQKTLRRYLLHSKELSKTRQQELVLASRISLGLQGRVAMENPVSAVLVEKVYWMNNMDSDAVLMIVRVLEPCLYGDKEIIPMHEKMIIMQNGVAGVGYRILMKNEVYGCDSILLESPHLLDQVMPRTLSYVDILILRKEDLKAVCKIFPRADTRLRRAQIRTAVFRNFVHQARLRKKQIKPSSRGAKYAQQKVGSWIHLTTLEEDQVGVDGGSPPNVARRAWRLWRPGCVK